MSRTFSTGSHECIVGETQAGVESLVLNPPSLMYVSSSSYGSIQQAGPDLHNNLSQQYLRLLCTGAIGALDKRSY